MDLSGDFDFDPQEIKEGNFNFDNDFSLTDDVP